VSHFESELRAISPNSQIQLHHVPGSFEIPLAAEILAGSRSVDAVATFGVLLDGSTAHATLVAQAVTSALLQTSLRHRIPVLHEILLVKDAAQAVARCLEPELNRGTEAARAAVQMLRTVETLRLPHSSPTE
jgi:6,7-dimethyl-8-ribityllumazine synthase